jgi:hypothetical protein
MSNTYQGSCLCREVKFAVEDFNQQAANCHCTMCRKFHGAAFGTLVGVKSLKWLSGKCLLKDFTAPNGTIRTFCKKCGSSLGFRVKGASLQEIELAIATFDCDIPVTVDAQIYTHYKANWCALHKGIYVFDKARLK